MAKKSVWKRWLSVGLAALLLTVGLSVPAEAVDYADVSGHWAEAAIMEWSNEHGLLQGAYGYFRPNDPMTRGELAAVLDRLLCYVEQSDNVYADLPEDWYTESILHLTTAGVLEGYEGYVRPMDNISRQEAVVALARAFQIPASSAALPYDDADSIADWAVGSVSAMTALGYIQGNGNLFRPEGDLTRAEAVTILDNIMSGIVSTGGTYTASVDGGLVVNTSQRVILRDMTIHGDLIITENANRFPVTLRNVTITGEIKNFSGLTPAVQGRHLGQFTYSGRTLDVLEGVPVNTYDLDQFVRDEETGRMTYAAEDLETLVGIDVSSWQRNIDWEAVAADGVDFAIIRVGYRGYTQGIVYEDAYFERNIQGALDAGLDVGVYFYSQAITEEEAIEEAEFVLERIEGYDITFPVVFDWELPDDEEARTNGLDNDILTLCALRFCETIEAAGYEPAVYFYTWLGYFQYDLSQFAQYGFWYAGTYPTFYYHFQMWQYSSTSVVAGISTGVDMNIGFVDYNIR